MMVNGREADLFNEDHKVAVSRIMNIRNLDTIDEELHAVLMRELDQIQLGNSPAIQADSNTGAVGERNPLMMTCDSVAGTESAGIDSPEVKELLCMHCD